MGGQVMMPGVTTRKGWLDVLSCDYNGWNDAPEEEREWFDQHPEIWDGPASQAAARPLRVTRSGRPRHRGNMAA